MWMSPLWARGKWVQANANWLLDKFVYIYLVLTELFKAGSYGMKHCLTCSKVSRAWGLIHSKPNRWNCPCLDALKCPQALLKQRHLALSKKKNRLFKRIFLPLSYNWMILCPRLIHILYELEDDYNFSCWTYATEPTENKCDLILIKRLHLWIVFPSTVWKSVKRILNVLRMKENCFENLWHLMSFFLSSVHSSTQGA